MEDWKTNQVKLGFKLFFNLSAMLNIHGKCSICIYMSFVPSINLHLQSKF